jgi:DNA-binding NarL/FixJ family response regulator
MSRATVLLADDHPVVAEGLASLLRSEFDVVGTVNDGGQLLEIARRARPDVIVTDFTMPGMTGLDALRQLNADGVASRVILLTVHADVELATEVLRAGAAGFVVKEAVVSELVAAIRTVLRGKTYVTPELAPDVLATLAEPATSAPREKLTPRQREVLRLLADGRTMKEVAATLGMSRRTAEAHKYQSMRALGFTTTAELIRYAVEQGLAPRRSPSNSRDRL